MVDRYHQKGGQGKGDHRKDQNQSRNSQIYSQAPYNFIPLNQKVVQAQEPPDFSIYHSDRYSGYIELEIEALTPLYIRDTLNEEELKQRNQHEARQNRGEKLPPYANPDFFSPGNLIRIPGSSLRGMIRTLVEIVSFGKFTNFSDRRLYYRSFADRCVNLKDNYEEHVTPLAGILIKQGLRYFIIPTKSYSIEKSKVVSILKRQGKKPDDFTIHLINGNDVNQPNRQFYLVISGPMSSKKVDYLIEKPNNYSTKIELSQDDIDDYRNDKERRARINLLDEVQKRGEAPCFYSIYHDYQGRRRVAFGHTHWFRIPYVKSIGDHVPEALRKPEILDFAEAIFGRETTHASRVFFEDCFFQGDGSPSLETATPKVLSSPKPTCFQHYIVQEEKNLIDHPRNLAHYNDPNPIRGYKLYWHREPDWIETDTEKINKHKTQYTKVKPVKEGTRFTGRIRFENLSSVELGALLFVLYLPDDCCHKLGMGKPLGLGSIKIKPVLHLSDRLKRYTNLFSEWIDKPKAASQDEVNKIIQAFESYVLDKLGEKTTNLWQHPRIKKLKLMLTRNEEILKNSSKTSYISDLREFRARKVLPEPDEVF